MRQLYWLAAAAVLAAAAPAAAADLCNAGDQSGWKPQADLEKQLTERGWAIKKVKIDDGCYEVYATDKDGNRKEVYFHPITFAVVKEES